MLYFRTSWSDQQRPKGSPLELSLSMLQTMAAAPAPGQIAASEQTPSRRDTAETPQETDAADRDEPDREPPPRQTEPSINTPEKKEEREERPHKKPPPARQPPAQKAINKPQDAAPTEAHVARTGPAAASQAQDGSSGQLTGNSDALLLKYKQALVAEIERHKFYPLRARRRGMEGVTIVGFIIDIQGIIKKVRIIQSSGHSLLDKTSLSAIEAIGRFPPCLNPCTEIRWNSASLFPTRWHLRDKGGCRYSPGG